MGSIERWSTVLVVLLFSFSVGSCIRWHMQPDSVKCLKEELRKNVLVNGAYAVDQVEGQTIDYVVKDSKNHILSQKQDISSGKFSFSVENYDEFEICFISKVTTKHNAVFQEIFMDIKTGTEAKNYDDIADTAKLKPFEVMLKHLEDLSQDIISDFSDMKKRANDMRNTNESTNKRVFYFGLFSMFCLLTLATWQVLYLRRYFKAKKLIE